MGRCGLAGTSRVLAGLALAAILGGAADRPAPLDAGHWRKAFARPDHTPVPPDNPATPDKVALGAKLFEDPRLSGSGDVACSTCHQADLSFSDGIDRHPGLDGQPLDRRTPPLWNLAWALSLFWDGRADSLETQAIVPIENTREMAGDLDRSLQALSADPQMRKAFASAFPENPAVTRANMAKALAAFQRTLVSPETRFDRWVKGEDAALEPDELAGLSLFVGKAACVACHKGWRFTDDAFHDIGLPGEDRGRGPILGIAAADHAFKTPSLRERVWSAPYMHDGSLAGFEDVVDHYADRVIRRPTLSADLPQRLDLSPDGAHAARCVPEHLVQQRSAAPRRPAAEGDGLRHGRGGGRDLHRQPEGPALHAHLRAAEGGRGPAHPQRRHPRPQRAPRWT